MPPVSKFILALTVWIFAGCIVSLAAVHGFWIGVWLFHSVPAARVCDAAGQIILLPIRGIFLALGHWVDQTAPLSAPFWFAVSNGALLGLAGYFLMRRVFTKVF